jgi:hypothetical protein
MGQIIYPASIAISDVDPEWMVGRTVTDCDFSEPSLWWFALSGGGHVQTEMTWRLLTSDKMIACSHDHGHSFGRPAPLDAAAMAIAETMASVIVGVWIDDAAPDLVIEFENGRILQILTTSNGYECWQTCEPSGRCVVVNGSRHAWTWQNEPPDPAPAAASDL